MSILKDRVKHIIFKCQGLGWPPTIDMNGGGPTGMEKPCSLSSVLVRVDRTRFFRKGTDFYKNFFQEFHGQTLFH